VGHVGGPAAVGQRGVRSAGVLGNLRLSAVPALLRGTNVLYECLTWTAATADIACCGRNNRVGRRPRGAFRQAIHTRRLRVSSTGTTLVARSRRFRVTGAVNAAAVSCARVLMQSIGRRATVEESGGAVTGCRCRAWLWRCSRVTATLCGSACTLHAVHCIACGYLAGRYLA
jgi:hypothetical protein